MQRMLSVELSSIQDGHRQVCMWAGKGVQSVQRTIQADQKASLQSVIGSLLLCISASMECHVSRLALSAIEDMGKSDDFLGYTELEFGQIFPKGQIRLPGEERLCSEQHGCARPLTAANSF